MLKLDSELQAFLAGGGTLVLLSVIDSEDFGQFIGVGDVMRAEARQEAERMLDTRIARIRDIGQVRTETVIREGRPAEAIEQLVAEDPGIAILVIAAGLPHVRAENWTPFMPYGFGGVVEGAAVVFFAVFGYDTITTAAEEARDPQRQLPRAVLLSLAVSLALYIAMSFVLTGIARYDTLNNPAPVASAFTAIGLPWVSARP